MIITRTPFRVSFFGGGTDYPVYLKDNKGAVLATTIDKYCYINCRHLPPFFKHTSKVVWSRIELVNSLDEIEHPSARECLRFMKIEKGIEIHHDGDLPARTGIGSSSSFTVGLLNSLYALKGKKVSKMQLAKDALYVEQEMIRENVGCQDQISAAFGGFNLIEFGPGKDFRVSPVIMDSERLKLFQSHLMLIFTGFSRTASEIAAEVIKSVPKKNNELKTMCRFVYEAVGLLDSKKDLCEFGKLLHENWQLKRSISDNITTPLVDEIYSAARKEGAIGGKLLGAGGGGFILVFAAPELHKKIRSKLDKFLHVPFQFEDSGSRVIFPEPS